MTPQKNALDALDEMEANEYWRRGDYSENIAIIRAALQAAQVPADRAAALPRYGLNWKGHDNAVIELMPDGYWTPWHIAEAALMQGGVARWQPIETAPKDGSRVLVAAKYFSDDTEVYFARNWENTERGSEGWRGESSIGRINLEPTHWQPLPQPPREGE